MPSGLLHQRTPPKDESQPRRKLGRILLWVEQNATFSSFSATHFVHRKNREKRRALGRALMDNCATRFWGIDSCAAQSREIKKPPSEYSGALRYRFVTVWGTWSRPPPYARGAARHMLRRLRGGSTETA